MNSGADFRHRSFASPHGSELHYWTCGTAGAPWIAMCHGGALDHSGFVPIARALADRWRVLLWDLPGHGLSQPLPRPFTVDACVNAFGAVLDDAGVDRATLLGFSFGGVVAQLYAARNPARERGVVAYSCLAPLHLKLPIPEWSIAPFTWLLFGRLPWPKARAKFARMCSLREDVRARLEPIIDRLGSEGFTALVNAQYRVRAYEPTVRFNGPLLVMHGDQDPHLRGLRSVIDALRRAHPDLALQVIPASGHCAHEDNPAAFTHAILGWLSDQVAPRCR